ncbi:TetR/AcrR family transcriptional regulator [Paracoccus liaowanqingii]|uniref:TetR/AcrR family transcriptional regulator n=2 Tax=Paracoccus liaowanqingii TaxID=2560053 RepID=A0A4V1BJD7_9RHOB|nr:TetR/AcrR family transcriptional regulator [Paracoccus liaowanqingii]
MSGKMPKADRRAQLLDVAHRIVRQQGTDALTLGTLADQAGVSKPITYNHFETRSGLLVALYGEIMDRQTRALADAIKDTGQALDQVSRVLAEAYMDCHASIGPEWHAIGAALRGSAEMDGYQRRMIEGHVAFFGRVLSPLTELPDETVHRRCVGIIGAAEALSDAMVRGQTSRDHAVSDLDALIVGWLRR